MSNSELLADLRTAFVTSLINANAGMRWLDHDSMDEMIEAAWVGFEGPAEVARTQLDELRAALVEARKWLCPPGPPVNPSHPIGQTILMIDKAIGGTND